MLIYTVSNPAEMDRYVAELDTATLQLLAAQTAAAVLLSCRRENALRDVIASYNPRWADHGYINALQQHVGLLYAIAGLWTDRHNRGRLSLLTLEPAVRQMTVDALAAYQKRKTEQIAADKLIFGPNWGDATSYNKMDWTDRNAALLED